MATFNTAFGSLPGYKEMMGTTNSTAGGEEKPPTVYGGQAQAQRKTQQPAQTFAQMQAQGQARPAAPAAPTPTAFGQYGGSQQGQQLRSQLQQRLTEFGQAPSRYDTESFKQIRGAQAANLQAEYQGQKKALDEDLAGRGLYASSIGGGRMGDLAGQQARATASLDAQLLQQAADTQAQDRAQFMQSGQGLAELAGSQDLQQFEANRVAQAATFENQLRAAQFGQQQFEQAGQEAFQGAQSEEAASQAARQFDLSAVGQTGGLSLDLQRLLGSQETERAGLTGQLGGQQTLAGQQQSEQRRQFDLQQRLQEQLGLGGLGVQQQEVGIKQQALQQQATDAAAERTLRESLQTRELTAAERQQLTDITSRKELQTQQIGAQQAESAAERDIRLRLQSGQITAEQAQQERQLASAATLQSQQLMQQAQQFGLSLNETQADRLQKYGLSVQELGLRSQQIQQEGTLQGRQISIQEAQNTAQNQIEREKIGQQAQQFGLSLNEQQTQRVQQYGISLQELANATFKAQQDASLQGRQLNIAEAQNLAQNKLEADKTAAQKTIAEAENVAQAERLSAQIGASKEEQALNIQQRLQEFLTQQTGNIYDKQGKETPGTTIAGQEASFQRAQAMADSMSSQTGNQYKAVRNDTTGMFTVQEVAGSPLEKRTQSVRAQDLDRTLRQALGMSEASGYIYDPASGARTGDQTVQSQQANNQLFMQLASVLSGLTPTQQEALKRGQYAAPGAPVNGQISGKWKFNAAINDWEANTE